MRHKTPVLHCINSELNVWRQRTKICYENRWKLLIPFYIPQKTRYRKTKKFIWRNVCRIRDYILNFQVFKWWTTFFAMILPSTNPTPKRDDSLNPSFIDMSDTESPIKNFSLSNSRNADDSSMQAKIVNSTPVIRHGFRSRSSVLRWEECKYFAELWN